MGDMEAPDFFQLARFPAKWNHFADKETRQSIGWSKSLSPKSSTLAGFALVAAVANTIAAHADELTARRGCDHHLDATRYAVQIR